MSNWPFPQFVKLGDKIINPRSIGAIFVDRHNDGTLGSGIRIEGNGAGYDDGQTRALLAFLRSYQESGDLVDLMPERPWPGEVQP